MPNQRLRIGIGYDIHKLANNRKLIIGGIEIPYEQGLLGHSDADVLVHAIIDAMLGALALPDIGTLFPDTDIHFKDINSLILLTEVYKKITEKGYKISNLDSNIIAQAPKMMPYISQMKSTLCNILNLQEEDISIKAKTKENLDAVGAKMGIEAQAVILLEKI